MASPPGDPVSSPVIDIMDTLDVMDEMDEEENLARRFREGDGDALEELLEGCQPDLRRVVERRLPRNLRHRVSVHDVMQEARFAAFESRGNFIHTGAGSFRRWVLGIAQKKVLMAIRHHLDTGKRSARREAGGPDAPTVSRVASRGPTPSEVAVAGEAAACARAALETLSDDERRMLALTREQGLTVAAAGLEMDLAPGIAKRLYGRALVKFRGEFERRRGSADGQ